MEDHPKYDLEIAKAWAKIVAMETKIRTLGLYQPYASLMMHNKVESRWVAKGKKPPYPLGKYLIYSTKKSYNKENFKNLSGEFYGSAMKALEMENTVDLNGYALCVGELHKVEKMYPLLLAQAFVGLRNMTHIDWDTELNELKIDDHLLWALHFKNIKRIIPFPFKGKQGVGFLSEEDKLKIQYI